MTAVTSPRSPDSPRESFSMLGDTQRIPCDKAIEQTRRTDHADFRNRSRWLTSGDSHDSGASDSHDASHNGHHRNVGSSPQGSPRGPRRSSSYYQANADPTEDSGLPYRGNPKKIGEILGRTSEYLDQSEQDAYFGDGRGFDYSTIEYKSRIADPAKPPNRGCNFHYIRWKVRRTVEHLACRLFVLVLILVDISIVIVDLTNEFTSKLDAKLAIVSFAFSCFFLLEVSLRIFGVGPKYFFNFTRHHAWWNIVDFAVVVVTFITSVLDLTVENMATDGSKLVVSLRIIRVIRLFRICAQQDHLKTAARQIISENKRRYQQDGFDLDLCYVTERVIATSFPSSGKMSVYRNPIAEVSRFFNTQHKDKYMIYNLCSERSYDVTYFQGHVQRVVIDDHNVPTLQQMLDFTSSVISWLNADAEHVVAVHCKGGKGRTGTMICVYMVETGLFSTAGESLDYFGSRRTDLNVGEKFQGVETPSQSRYVGYYEWMKNNRHHLPPETPRLLTRIVISGMHTVGRGDGSDFSVVVSSRTGRLFEANCALGKGCIHAYDKSCDAATVTLTDCPVLTGDVQVKFKCSSRNVPRGYENVAFYFWFHTGFVSDSRLILKREDLDNPHKPNTWDVYTTDFSVDCTFS
ncbi:phosphatidylinositol 3,4,5-trisphosphate 3-phosphatase TPTE2-like isoform X2 [Pollicipes pollicipes]|uniref:phosphatidylinositol 3,4,5-trisphosphate 3-phosphatase TPTE2-like isoform X2 n=1 Tax=Pollicipes pollicipes TaxID=41117 RepID=UPI001885305D|nr:phosphatidylinositol 3,4,5-trisphosphate 3-phosphatase TPTE2-like isoform X2 [Pollicipes pollicipes]